MRLKILLLGGTTLPGFVIERTCGEFQLEIMRPHQAEYVFVDPPPNLIILTLSESQPFEDLKLLDPLKAKVRGIPVIAIAVRSSEKLAVAAFRTGCRDYLQYPYSQQELTSAIQRCVSMAPAPSHDEGADFDRLVGESASIAKVRSYVARVARRATTVLITGETGTGKEVVAELLHRAGANPEKPFVSVNCAAIPEPLLESELFGHERGSFTGAAHAFEGRLQMAGEGTIFLDEIGDMSPYGQVKILRAIENRQATRVGGRTPYRVRCRFVAATNQEIERSVASGRFRADLYYRLNVARIRLPALREHKLDIPGICRSFIRRLNPTFQAEVENCDEHVMEALFRYDWPGNVRELRNVLEAAYVNGPGRFLSMSDLPDWFRQAIEQTPSSDSGERDRLIAALTAAHWNKSRAADALKWSRMTLYRKLAKYALKA